jgi:Putative bacterial sensory transduction regulator
MTKNGLMYILSILILTLPITPIWAQDAATVADETITAPKDNIRYISTSKDLGEVLRYNGFDFKPDTIEGKEVLVVDVDGITTVVQFYGEDAEFDSVQLYAGFTRNSSSTVQQMNEWNSTHRFTRAYIDEQGDPVLEMDLNFAFGGVSERQLEDSLALWELSVVTFHTFIYDKNKVRGDAKTFIKKIRAE